jgi:hypothetical protein
MADAVVACAGTGSVDLKSWGAGTSAYKVCSIFGLPCILLHHIRCQTDRSAVMHSHALSSAACGAHTSLLGMVQVACCGLSMLVVGEPLYCLRCPVMYCCDVLRCWSSDAGVVSLVICNPTTTTAAGPRDPDHA